MSRIPLEPDFIYHVWTHANGSENLFRSKDNYRYFLENYIEFVQPVAETFAYCLMPNHLHLMIRVNNKNKIKTLPGFETLEVLKLSKGVSRRFSHLFNGYAQAYNCLYNRKGSLFMDSFNRKQVDSDEYFTILIAYIHNNPVHHGFVEGISEWPYSSWHSYLNNEETWINRTECIDWFGNKGEFLRVHKALKPDRFVSLFEE